MSIFRTNAFLLIAVLQFSSFIPEVFSTEDKSLGEEDRTCDRTMSTFLYFAYGSNLLTKRIHLQNPSAVRKAIALLKNYRLDFTGHSNGWGGAVATIEPEEGKEVWGVVWEIDKKDQEHLDRQEGVQHGVYKPLNVTVNTSDNRTILCRTYRHSQSVPPSDVLPEERWPSMSYMTVIIAGAREAELPSTYISQLEQIPHNNCCGELVINSSLDAVK